ncbi:MAG: FeoA family protein [Candidatus Eisenbacteria bacterium]|nr:FeoA family protein [Candidatus Eisenbacteria bacterium]
MTDKKQMTLTRMQSGRGGVVVQIDGGCGLVSRLDALGIRPGRRVTKVSSMLMRGPVTIEMNGARVAIGFGMAKKVIVEPDGDRE